VAAARLQLVKIQNLTGIQDDTFSCDRLQSKIVYKAFDVDAFVSIHITASYQQAPPLSSLTSQFRETATYKSEDMLVVNSSITDLLNRAFCNIN